MELALQGTSNRSTLPDARFDQADIGPFLSFQWNF